MHDSTAARTALVLAGGGSFDAVQVGRAGVWPRRCLRSNGRLLRDS